MPSRQPSYRGKCRAVAAVDLILSCLCLGLSIFMLVTVLNTGNNPEVIPGANAEMINGIRMDVIWSIRIGMEVMSIVLAAKLLHSTFIHHSPDKAAQGGYVWMIGCSIWIFSLIVGIAVKMMEPQLYKSHYLEILILVVVIVLRLGAINVVINYVNEHKTCLQQALIA